MKNNRMYLYIIFGVIAFALWTAWQKDYTKSQPAPSAATAVALNPASSVNTQTNIGEITLNAKSVPSGRLINVKTDVLDIAIDTRGGNIVSAKLLKYPVSLEQKDKPTQILNDNPEQYYTASSALISSIGPDTSLSTQAQYLAAKQSFTLEPGQNELTVKLALNKNGLLVTKNFTFKRGQYDINVGYNIQNNLEQTWSGKFAASLSRKKLSDDKGGLFHFQTFTGPAISSPEKPYEKLDYSKLDTKNLDRSIKGGWLAFQQHYFLSAWAPEQNSTNNFFTSVLPDQIYLLGLQNDVTVKPHQTVTTGGKFYVGPEIASSLATIAPNLNLTVDYGWFWFISIGLFWLLQQIYKFIGNYGWSIIMVTIIIKLAFYKLSEKSYSSMAKMRQLAPQIQALKERYGDDRQKIGQATMELYKREKVNPLGGCLPNLIQIPFFIALYYVIIESVQLRQAPFIFWIQDLSAKDPYFVLPILMGLSMLIQNKFNPPSPDPTQAKMMMLLPVVFTVFFINFPSGLVLYWFLNNCLNVLQQWYITRNLRSEV